MLVLCHGYKGCKVTNYMMVKRLPGHKLDPYAGIMSWIQGMLGDKLYEGLKDKITHWNPIFVLCHSYKGGKIKIVSRIKGY